ncbi:ATP-dependent helicase [Patescibacteria group bacterium]|nr:ATP-dependent helicase [Patescibacteria group bacterium]MBU1028945.1 ATP-dependent helicase [Patescibacteria group bacterium]MBU1916461.1 ATP-dependent helicase [Patescibacteria group bacterium]
MSKKKLTIYSKNSVRSDFRSDLNDEQHRVVTGGDGPCLVLAGAGSGKTRTVVYRVAYLIQKGIRPDEILLLTFTNKAAGEMMSRIDKLLADRGLRSGGIWGGTFHSIANRLLRRYAERLSYTSSFTILDQEDTKAMLKASIKELGFDGQERRFPSPAVVQSIASYAKNSMISVNAVLERKYADFEHLERDIVSVLETYDHKKRNSNSMDFDDLLLNLYFLLTDYDDVRRVVANQFRYVLVDEYQDTNALQDSIVRLIAEAHGNVLAVGDDAQSIYSFRAADIKNILQFPERFTGTKQFKLETNYRSTPEILALANDIISRNTNQFPKTLRSVLPGSALPKVQATPSAAREAEFIATQIEDLVNTSKVDPREIAVLFRATHHSQQLEFELLRRGVEYEYRGGMRFFERAHVKDVLAYLRLVHNFADESAWHRVLSFQSGIGDVTAGRIYGAALAQGDLARVVLAPIESLVGKRAAVGWRDLRATLEGLTGAGDRPADLIRSVLASPYIEYLNNEYPNARERLEDLGQLAAFADGYDQTTDFLAEVALNDSIHRQAPATKRWAGLRIILSTIHQAKGLEWDTVFVMHLTGSGFPNQRAFLEPGGLEEERRLFYVAVTRAKRRLFLCYPRRAGFDGATMEYPSMFITEADADCLDVRATEAEINRFNASGENHLYSDPDYEDDTVELDQQGELHQVKKRLQNWRKKSFLRDV